jgi:hypothetical protein
VCLVLLRLLYLFPLLYCPATVDISADGESKAGLALSHVVSGLEPDTQYVFWVRPVNAVGTGPRGKASTPVSVQPLRYRAQAA